VNISGIGSLLGVATQLLGGGALGSLASGALGGGQQQAGGATDPFSAIAALTSDVDGLASGGLGSLLGGGSGGIGTLLGGGGDALGSIAGLLA
jgi:hypothetical protein